jgi:hypothetical protein
LQTPEHPQKSPIHVHDPLLFRDLIKPALIRLVNKTRLHAILLRYSVEEAARRFDLCDQKCHFAAVIPQQAATSPPPLNAIYTISARLLYRLPQYRNSDGIIEWNGNTIPGLTEETAVYFYNEQAVKSTLRAL